MHQWRSILVVIMMSSFISACALAPGHKMNASKVSDDGSDASKNVELVTITPEIIKEHRGDSLLPSVPQALLEYQPSSYRVGPNDVLFITVWNHPELTVPGSQFNSGDTNGRIIKPDGKLFYPYIGDVEAAGKTTEELRSEISQKLAKFIESPQVDVGVMRYFSQRVILSGAFANSQPIPITSTPLSLTEALGLGKADIEHADLSRVIVKRDGVNYEVNFYSLTRLPSEINQIYLKDGDSIHLPYNDQNKVFIMGEVVRPQALPMKSSSITLTDAIGTAGGIHQLSSKGKDVYVIRGVNDLHTEKATIYQLNAKSPSAFILANNFDLQAQDVVYVGASGVTRWNRVISQIMPTISLLGTTSRAWYDVDRVNN